MKYRVYIVFILYCLYSTAGHASDSLDKTATLQRPRVTVTITNTIDGTSNTIPLSAGSRSIVVNNEGGWFTEELRKERGLRAEGGLMGFAVATVLFLLLLASSNSGRQSSSSTLRE
jgi:hypothetical protein